MEIITRDELKKLNIEDYTEIIETESHHKHQIIEESGVLRWKESKGIRSLVNNISLNDLCPLLNKLGHGLNSEVYRKLYRDLGYSFSGYWEIFYQQNDFYDEYRSKEHQEFLSNLNTKPIDI